MPSKAAIAGREMGIGAMSQATGVNIETIRYYERIGILPPPPRSRGGHRLYGVDHVKRLAFVRRSRELGFSLQEVRGLLDLVDGGGVTCDQVKFMTLGHLDEVRRRIADLRRMERVLREMAATCAGGDVPECPIVDALFRDPASVR